MENYIGWLRKAEAFDFGSDSWFNISARGFGEYADTEGDVFVKWRRGGYRTLFDVLSVSPKCPPTGKPTEDVRRGNRSGNLNLVDTLQDVTPLSLLGAQKTKLRPQTIKPTKRN